MAQNKTKLKINLNKGIPTGTIGEHVVMNLLDKQYVKYKYQATIDNGNRADFLVFVDNKIGFLEVWSKELTSKTADTILGKYYQARIGGTFLSFGWIVCNGYGRVARYEDIDFIELKDFEVFLSNFEEGRISKVVTVTNRDSPKPKKHKKRFFSNFEVCVEKRFSIKKGGFYEGSTLKRKPLIECRSDILKHLYAVGFSQKNIDLMRGAMSKQYGGSVKKGRNHPNFYRKYIQGNNYDSATRMLCGLVNIPPEKEGGKYLYG